MLTFSHPSLHESAQQYYVLSLTTVLLFGTAAERIRFCILTYNSTLFCWNLTVIALSAVSSSSKYKEASQEERVVMILHPRWLTKLVQITNLELAWLIVPLELSFCFWRSFELPLIGTNIAEIRLWIAAVKSGTAKVYCCRTTFKSGTAFTILHV